MVPHYPYSPSMLAKAAAPERAATERGPDFDDLQLPRRSIPWYDTVRVGLPKCSTSFLDNFTILDVPLKMDDISDA